LFKQAGLSMTDVDAQALSNCAAEFEHIDFENERYERRRDRHLQKVESRRSGWAKLVKNASEEIVEGQYRELPSQDDQKKT
jgi:hypothetical protein